MPGIAVTVRVIRHLFRNREVLFHDDRALRRLSVTAARQAVLTALATVTIGFFGCGAAQAAGGAEVTGVVKMPTAKAQFAGMERRLDTTQAKVETTRIVAAPHGQPMEQRQSSIAAMPTGVAHVSAAGMGGPLIPADSAEASADLKADQQFRNLFNTWKKLDTLQQGVISIPSVHPVEKLAFTSNFGIRSDPFRGTAAMHAGVDISGPVGTPIYATADGVVDRAERAGGYGNLVEIDHGKGIATRYGHLSKILVEPGTHIHRGQLIALMGSTGRSTGPHLHYEVRIDGRAVNPAPFLTNADFLVAAQDRSVHAIPVVADSPESQD